MNPWLKIVKNPVVHLAKKSFTFQISMKKHDTGTYLLNVASFLGWFDVLPQLSVKNGNACGALSLITAPSIWEKNSIKSIRLISKLTSAGTLLNHYSALPRGCNGNAILWKVLVNWKPNETPVGFKGFSQRKYDDNVVEAISKRILILVQRVKYILLEVRSSNESNFKNNEIGYFIEFFKVVNGSIHPIFLRAPKKLRLAIGQSNEILPEIVTKPTLITNDDMSKMIKEYINEVRNILCDLYNDTTESGVFEFIVDSLLSRPNSENAGFKRYIEWISDKQPCSIEEEIKTMLEVILQFCKNPKENVNEFGDQYQNKMAELIHRYIKNTYEKNSVNTSEVSRAFCKSIASIMSNKNYRPHDKGNYVYKKLSDIMSHLMSNDNDYRKEPRYCLNSESKTEHPKFLIKPYIVDISKTGVLIRTDRKINGGEISEDDIFKKVIEFTLHFNVQGKDLELLIKMNQKKNVSSVNGHFHWRFSLEEDQVEKLNFNTISDNYPIKEASFSV